MAESYAPEIDHNLPDLVTGPVQRVDQILRRLMDVFVSAVGLALLSPVFLFLGLLIKRDSPGPVFYHGRRVGRGGKEFKILKFRTMYETPESHNGPAITRSGDERITLFGQWLRETKLNELPQLWNVLAGDMSLVGPRPEVPEFVLDWPEEVREVLLSVRPGITSPASITYRDEEKLLSQNDFLKDYFQDILPSKLRLDRLYIRNRTLLTDLDVIFLTALSLLPSLRNRKFPEYYLYWGPIARGVSRYGLWFLVDWIIALLSTWVAGMYWRTLGPLDVGLFESLGISIAIAVLFSFTNQFLGLNYITWARARMAEAVWLVLSAGTSTFLVVVLDRLLLGKRIFPTGAILAAGVLATVGFGVARYGERLVTVLAARWVNTRKATGRVGERVLIIGAGEMGDLATWLFSHGDFARAFSIVGMVDDNPRKIGMLVNGLKVLGTTRSITELVERLDIGVVVFAIAHIERQERERILQSCQCPQVKIVLFPDLMDAFRTSMLPEEDILQVAGQRIAQNGALERARMGGSEIWLDELDALLAAQDIYGARALLVELKAEYNKRKETV